MTSARAAKVASAVLVIGLAAVSIVSFSGNTAKSATTSPIQDAHAISPAHALTPIEMVTAVRARLAVTSITPVAVASPAVTPAVLVPVIAVVVPTEPTVATLVAEVQAAGIEPGSNWSWTMGDSATHCGAISGVGTGCTFGSAGLEQSIFSGSPTLALVAHELANAETQNDAVPSLLSEVAAAEGGTSWSPTDAVASCLVEHFMGFQDNSAGTWQCPASLASFVTDNIHDTY